MKDFLTNDICKFEILNRAELLTDNINIIVSSFFKIEANYKDFGVYVNGLQILINFIDDQCIKNKNKFIFVIFIDHNIYNDADIYKIIEKSPNTVPILFKCAKYMKGDFHVDLFGTLTRFFPMFDFPNNPCKISICVDIDLEKKHYVRLDTLMNEDMDGAIFAGDVSNPKYTKGYVYAYANIIYYNRQKEDHTLITNFIKTAEHIESKGYYNKRYTTFGYGIDEIFLNDIFLPLLKNYKIIIDYQISYFLYHSKPIITEKKKLDNTSEFLSMILGNLVDPKSSIKEKLRFLDENTYHIRERTKITDEISRRFTFVIKYLTDNNKYWLEPNAQDFIYKYLKNTISANLVIDIDHTLGMTGAKLYKGVFDSDYVEKDNN